RSQRTRSVDHYEDVWWAPDAARTGLVALPPALVGEREQLAHARSDGLHVGPDERGAMAAGRRSRVRQPSRPTPGGLAAVVSEEHDRQVARAVKGRCLG